MLVNSVLYVFVAIVVFTVMLLCSKHYQKKKGKEIPYSIQVTWFCLMMMLIFGFFFLPRVHIVNDNEHKERILIGFTTIKLDNGNKVSIRGKSVVNNSSRHIYVETLDYLKSYSKLYRHTILVEKIKPYSVYKGKINYAFKKPLETIHTTPLSPSTKRKWLRERNFDEEK